MEVFNTPGKIIITCYRRLSPYLQNEVRHLGFDVKHAFSTGIELHGTVNDCIRLNLNLHCAGQVLYALKAFQANDPQELYEALVDIPWETLIAFDGYVSVTSNVNNSTISTPLFANLKVKDAIADRIKSKKGLRPDSGPDLHRTVVHLHWWGDRAEIFLDTSGENLAKHSYRKHPGKAPMLEALAAGVVYATAWDRQSAFVNPMCGSGTLAIEAALIATNRKPGLLRMNYAFMHILGYDEQVFFAERRKLKEQVNKSTTAKIIASDRSKEAIDIAMLNAKTAGVDKLIDFHVCDFTETPIPPPPGVVVFNPEYGERMGVHTKLEATYSRIGDFFKQQCRGYNGYVFTGNPDLAKKIGLHSSRRIEFYNGRLDCRLLEYEIYEGSRRKAANETS